MPKVVTPPHPESAPEVLLLSPEEVRRLLAGGEIRGEPVAVLDARGRAAWARSGERIAGDLRVPGRDLSELIPRLPREGWIFAYCT